MRVGARVSIERMRKRALFAIILGACGTIPEAPAAPPAAETSAKSAAASAPPEPSAKSALEPPPEPSAKSALEPPAKSGLDARDESAAPRGRSANEQLPLGERAREWRVTDWINSEPLTLADLRGHVVLVRWWTGGCPFCSATAPALNALRERYADRGLVVLGFYHHKAETPFDRRTVIDTAKQLGLEIPIAVDPQWQTLNDWWLTGRERAWTSVSFLIDRRGIIRHVHPGGTYAIGDADYRVMEKKIEELLSSSS